MHLQPWQLAMVFVPLMAQSLLVLRMSLRETYRRFPWFFIYTAVHVADMPAIMLAKLLGDWPAFYAYWGGEAIDIFLSLMVIQELYNHAFSPFETLRGLADMIFRWATFVLCGICIIMASFPQSHGEPPLMRFVLELVKSTNFMMMALLALLFGLSAFFGMKWQKLSFSIAMGMGVICAIDAAATAIRSNLGPSSHWMYRVLAPLAYNLGCAIYVYGVFAREKVVSIAAHDRVQLETWDKALQGIEQR